MGISPDRLITLNRGASTTVGNMQVEAVIAYHTDDSVVTCLMLMGQGYISPEIQLIRTIL